MFIFLTSSIIFCVLLFLSIIVVGFLTTFISINKFVSNILIIVVTSLIVVLPMNLIYFSVNNGLYPLFEEQSHRWDNINNLTSFLFLWFFVILLSSVFFKVLVYIYGLFKKSPSNDSFFLLVFILCILFSIFSTMDFFMSHPVGLEKQPECINPVWETGKFGTRYLKCDNK